MKHYDDVIMGAMASQITSLTIVYSTVYVRGIHRGHTRYVAAFKTIVEFLNTINDAGTANAVQRSN